MDEMYSFFVDLIDKFLTALWSYIIAFLQLVINGIAAGMTYGLSLLPEYTVPTPTAIVNTNGWLEVLNWIVPVDFFLLCLTMWVFAMIAFHTIGPFLRVFKVLR